jgi:hypothetical protein
LTGKAANENDAIIETTRRFLLPAAGFFAFKSNFNGIK